MGVGGAHRLTVSRAAARASSFSCAADESLDACIWGSGLSIWGWGCGVRGFGCRMQGFPAPRTSPPHNPPPFGARPHAHTGHPWNPPAGPHNTTRGQFQRLRVKHVQTRAWGNSEYLLKLGFGLLGQGVFARKLISHKVFIQLICKSQFPHKFANLFFVFV